MGTPILDRDRLPGRVFQRGRMALASPTYHRPAALPATLLATLALVVPASAATPTTVVIEGAGEGHGVGMSQDGALGLAQHGLAARQILAHYYSGTTIGLAPAPTVVRVLIGSSVRRIPLERYVRGVVSAEVSPSWPAAALQAQAIASRTYAITAHAGGSRFDVYSDTRSQVYRGKAAETPATNAAVAATAGQIVTFEGKPAITYFFASSGGMTEDAQNGFPGSEPEPWLKAVTDPYEGVSSKWTVDLTFTATARRLKGLYKGSFRGIEVLTRGVSPRILTARVMGSTGASVVTGPQLAARLGLGSTWAYFSVVIGGVRKPEPDHSGRPHGAPTGPAKLPSASPPATAAGGVSPIESNPSAGPTNGTGGTAPGT